MHLSQPDLTNPVQLARVRTWVVANTPQGRGNYLVGEDGPDVLIVAPPGVRLRTEEGAAAPLCAEGWRLSRFVPVDDEAPLVDRHRPTTLYDIGVVGALEEIVTRCPQHLLWFADRLEELVRSAWMISQPDINGDVPLLAARRVTERDETLAQLTPAQEQMAGLWPEFADERLCDPYYLVALRDALDRATPQP